MRECDPMARVEMLNCAALFESVAELRVVAPSMKVIDPEAVVPAGGCTVAVKTRVCAKLPGFADEISVTEVEAWLTVCVNADEVPAA